MIHLLRLQNILTLESLSGKLGKKKRSENWLKAVENVITFARSRPFACMEQKCNSPSGFRAIYSGDDTWAGNIKKCLKEACGSDFKRQVVEFMYETVSFKGEGSKMQARLCPDQERSISVLLQK